MITDKVNEQLDRLIRLEEQGQVAEDTDYRAQIKQRWKDDPYAWARERLGFRLTAWSRYSRERYHAHVWDGTREPLYTAAKHLANSRNVAISSATGVGKTVLGALLVYWFLDCFPPADESDEGSIVITVAPKEDQLTLHIWKQLSRFWPLFHRIHPNARMDTLRIRMRPSRDDWGAVGFVCGVGADEDVANKARGFHARDMLFIFEETTGVHLAIQAAFRFTCTAPHNLRLFFGNPDHDQDPLAMAMRQPDVVPIRASAHDHPNIVCEDDTLMPGGPSVKQLDAWKADPAMGEESPQYRSRARGIAPSQSAEALIRAEWLDACMSFTPEQRAKFQAVGGKVPAIGYDLAASQDGDQAAHCYGLGAAVVELKARRCPDPGEDFRNHILPMITSGMVKGSRVGYDSVGVGVGAQTEAKRVKHPMSPLNGGERYWEEAAKNGEVFNNLRSQMYWELRTDVAARDVALPRDPELRSDLLAIEWTTLSGKIVVKSKEKVREQIGRSPNKGDAVVYWNWIRKRQRTLTFDAMRTMKPVTL